MFFKFNKKKINLLLQRQQQYVQAPMYVTLLKYEILYCGGGGVRIVNL